ncbi:diguanylate cyclase (GGDEF) domain-containing protein [Noviherbaspirillum humi]|uniref:Diguanylate cyclase (GGDEF) domain-containing protein n=1 Tax=Noviherbaspirillum humi TaxID=1688639 RepID=A0A239IF28_9BURK|nr:EAL domain-containing protein [Noviherbaspirillum humi]SNS92157.1 diguanylate cyclase (GGDEF) domain-containing protein [Noviherbaspirillum humi]
MALHNYFHRLATLCRRCPRHTWIPVLMLFAALACAVLAWTYFLESMRKKEDQAYAETYTRVDGLARSYADRVERTMDVLDRILLHVRYDWNISKGQTKLEGAKEAGVFPADSVLVVSIFDREGRALTSTAVSGDAQFNIADRSYFQFHRDVQQDTLLVSRPMMGRTSEREVIVLSRRLIGDGGRFAGVVIASMRPEFLTANFSEATYGGHGYLGLTGFDHVMRAARIGNANFTPHAPASVAVFTPDPDTPHGATLLDGKQWFADGRSRIVGWHQVEGHPLTALVGLDEEEALARFRAAGEAAAAAAYWATGAFAASALIAAVLLHLLLKRKSESEAARLAYRAATEEGEDGFFINRPLRDKAGNVVDYLVVDCNQHGAEMFQLQRDQLIGKSIGNFYEGRLKSEALMRLNEALHKGIHQSEIRVTRRDRLKAAWINYKAVRSGSDVAVTIRDITESKAHLEELERRGNEDALTGLPNRYWIQNYLPSAMARVRDASSALALLFIDIDGFKDINDALGHAAGDDLLKMIARRLMNHVRPQDHVVRLGGDEYVVLMEQVHGEEEVILVADRVMASFGERFQLSMTQHAIGASIGISLFPRDASDAQELLKHADIAMYEAKKNGKGNYRFFQPHFRDAVLQKLNSEIDIRRAIEHDEFEMHYQPRVDISTMQASSLEALVRWNHPDRGLVSPLEFIPLAEATGLILPLGELIIQKVCRQISEWSTHGNLLLPVSINVSPRQFNESDILFLFRSNLERHGLNPKLVQIEITESVMMQESSRSLDMLPALRDMGIKLCLDDFGTGYSSLSQLQKIQFDVLKIDRSFTSEVEKPEGRALIASMVTMAQALGLKVVAEGVETSGQLQILRELGCDEAQGYYFSKPVPAAKLPGIAADLRRQDRTATG